MKKFLLCTVLVLSGCGNVDQPDKKLVFGQEFTNDGYDCIGYDDFDFIFVRQEFINNNQVYHYIIINRKTLKEDRRWYQYTLIIPKYIF